VVRTGLDLGLDLVWVAECQREVRVLGTWVPAAEVLRGAHDGSCLTELSMRERVGRGLCRRTQVLELLVAGCRLGDIGGGGGVRIRSEGDPVGQERGMNGAGK